MDGLKPADRRRADAMGRMDRAQLEALLARYCRAQGYVVESGGSGGINAKFGDAAELVLRRDDEFVLVQCRHWTATTVSQDAVQALLDVMADLDATGGVLVTGGAFSSAAVELASRQGGVELVDAEILHAMLGTIPDDPGEAPELCVGADVFDQGAYSGDNVEWLMFSAGDRARSGMLAGAPTGRLLLLSLGLKLTLAFALVLLFAWAIDTAVHPLLQPLRLHRVTADAELMSAPEGYVMRPGQSARQDPIDDATPDAWHQPSEDELLQQKRKGEGATKVKDGAPAL